MIYEKSFSIEIIISYYSRIKWSVNNGDYSIQHLVTGFWEKTYKSINNSTLVPQYIIIMYLD